MTKLFDIKDKVIVITGACGVLGSAAVEYFAQQGAKVVLLGRQSSAEKGAALVESVKAQGGEAVFLLSDVMDKALLEKNYEEVIRLYGRVDVLLNLSLIHI